MVKKFKNWNKWRKNLSKSMKESWKKRKYEEVGLEWI